MATGYRQMVKFHFIEARAETHITLPVIFDFKTFPASLSTCLITCHCKPLCVCCGFFFSLTLSHLLSRSSKSQDPRLLFVRNTPPVGSVWISGLIWPLRVSSKRQWWNDVLILISELLQVAPYLYRRRSRTLQSHRVRQRGDYSRFRWTGDCE